MRCIFIVAMVILYINSSAQSGQLASFESKFSLVANQSVAWSTLIDSLKATGTMSTYKLEATPVWTDPCQMVQQQGARCPRIAYYKYFKKAIGSQSSVITDDNVLILSYEFETNERPGHDTLTNIDTVRLAKFVLGVVPNNATTSRRRKQTYLQLCNEIERMVNKYYGQSLEASYGGRNVLLKKYWPYSNGVGTLASLQLTYKRDTEQYILSFVSNIYPKNYFN